MRREYLIVVLLFAFLVIFLLWRQSNLEDELQATKRELNARIDAFVSSQKSGSLIDPGAAVREGESGKEMKRRLESLEYTFAQMQGTANALLAEPDQKSPIKRAWSAQQAIGSPDTMVAGDMQTAWASQEPDAGVEWLKLGYDGPIPAAKVVVRESFNPGAISRVSVTLDGGAEMTIWQGTETAAVAPVDREFSVPGAITVHSVKIYLDTSRVPGWNEIDAVGIVDLDGKTHWAVGAAASSSYGETMGQQKRM